MHPFSTGVTRGEVHPDINIFICFKDAPLPTHVRKKSIAWTITKKIKVLGHFLYRAN